MEGTSLLTPAITAIISQFAADIIPTVMALVGLLIPVSISLWSIGFGMKKALRFLQKNAEQAL